MQEMTSSICSSLPDGTEGQLEDTRDGQLYYVGKMKDGKCWMLQNLALGSTSSATALSYADSNITAASWTLPKSYTAANGGGSDYTAIQSWNFGKWVLATPELGTNCGTSGITSLDNCTKVGFVDVSDITQFQPTYTATTGVWNGATVTDNTLVAVNCTSWSGSGESRVCTSGIYDAHYLVGNYYSWNAATAGTGGSITSGQASGSICPKGWKLPTSNSTTVRSFAELLSQYGISSSLSGTIDGVDYNIAGSPLRFVRGGNINSAGLGSAGDSGRYWSSTPYSNGPLAYHLSFDTYGAKPTDAYTRDNSFSVRCISQ